MFSFNHNTTFSTCHSRNRWGMICDSWHRKRCWKPGITLKMDEQVENVLTTVSVLALGYLKTAVSIPLCCIRACMRNKLSAISMWPKVVFWQDLFLFRNAALPINEHCCSSLAKFLSFVSWKAWTVPYCWQREEKKDLRLKACTFIEKQDALGRELVQVQ